MKSYASIGDFGDIIFSLPCVKLNEKGIYYGVDRPDCRSITPRLPILKRLLESQPYIHKLLPHSGQKIDYDFCDFRDNGMPFGVTLGKLHADYVGLKPDLNEPWISVKPSKESKGKIVVARSPRYRNSRFPWRSIVEQYRDKIIFIGLPEEYHNFTDLFGKVPYFPTNDLYEVAELIAGSELFIGNQSSPNAICEGLKHRSILEVSLNAPDCIYPRDNVIHCYDGGLSFEVLGRKFESEPKIHLGEVDLGTVPPGGWKVKIDGNTLTSYAHGLLIDHIRAHFQLGHKEATEKFFELLELPIPDSIQRVRDLVTSQSPQASLT